MKEVINNFLEQFNFEAFIENRSNLKFSSKYLIIGMGGSHLAADFLNFIFPSEDIAIHKDYSLPHLKDLQQRTVIAISVSGETEETIDDPKRILSSGIKLCNHNSKWSIVKTSTRKTAFLY